jgi:CheY-like chemotaxis protein
MTKLLLPKRKARILIVDDERDNRELLEIVLRWDGLVVRSATNGVEALELVARELPDLVLLDVMMPDMTGYEVAAALKGNVLSQHIPVLMISALDDRTARRLATDAGADDFLAKPLGRDKLLSHVWAALGDVFADSERWRPKPAA